MSDYFSKIQEGLREIFPEIGDMEIGLEMELGELPEWDSMSSVNFQSFIEQNFKVMIPQDLLTEETKISEVISFIEDPEKIGMGA